VNNQGVAAGFYWLDGVHQHGFLLNDVSNNFQLLADPSVANLVLTQFLGINDNGEGYYQTTDGSQHGFTLQHKQRSYSFLDDPNAALSGVSITQITGINDSGEIAGFYVDAASGLQRGFYATVATPEPATLLLFPSGFMTLLLIWPSLRRKIASLATGRAMGASEVGRSILRLPQQRISRAGLVIEREANRLGRMGDQLGSSERCSGCPI
jgi:hypothetical protein